MTETSQEHDDSVWLVRRGEQTVVCPTTEKLRAARDRGRILASDCIQKMGEDRWLVAAELDWDALPKFRARAEEECLGVSDLPSFESCVVAPQATPTLSAGHAWWGDMKPGDRSPLSSTKESRWSRTTWWFLSLGFVGCLGLFAFAAGAFLMLKSYGRLAQIDATPRPIPSTPRLMPDEGRVELQQSSSEVALPPPLVFDLLGQEALLRENVDKLESSAPVSASSSAMPIELPEAMLTSPDKIDEAIAAVPGPKVEPTIVATTSKPPTFDPIEADYLDWVEAKLRRIELLTEAMGRAEKDVKESQQKLQIIVAKKKALESEVEKWKQEKSFLDSEVDAERWSGTLTPAQAQLPAIQEQVNQKRRALEERCIGCTREFYRLKFEEQRLETQWKHVVQNEKEATARFGEALKERIDELRGSTRFLDLFGDYSASTHRKLIELCQGYRKTYPSEPLVDVLIAFSAARLDDLLSVQSAKDAFLKKWMTMQAEAKFLPANFVNLAANGNFRQECARLPGIAELIVLRDRESKPEREKRMTQLLKGSAPPVELVLLKAWLTSDRSNGKMLEAEFRLADRDGKKSSLIQRVILRVMRSTPGVSVTSLQSKATELAKLASDSDLQALIECYRAFLQLGKGDESLACYRRMELARPDAVDWLRQHLDIDPVQLGPPAKMESEKGFWGRLSPHSYPDSLVSNDGPKQRKEIDTLFALLEGTAEASNRKLAEATIHWRKLRETQSELDSVHQQHQMENEILNRLRMEIGEIKPTVGRDPFNFRGITSPSFSMIEKDEKQRLILLDQRKVEQLYRIERLATDISNKRDQLKAQQEALEKILADEREGIRKVLERLDLLGEYSLAAHREILRRSLAFVRKYPRQATGYLVLGLSAARLGEKQIFIDAQRSVDLWVKEAQAVWAGAAANTARQYSALNDAIGGLWAFGQGETDAAIKRIQLATKQYPELSELWFLEGTFKVYQKDWSLAANSFNQIRKQRLPDARLARRVLQIAMLDQRTPKKELEKQCDELTRVFTDLDSLQVAFEGYLRADCRDRAKVCLDRLKPQVSQEVLDALHARWEAIDAAGPNPHAPIQP